MPTVIGYHDVKDTDHWLASPKREEFFGPLGVTNIRTFVDPTNRTRVGVLMDVADMDTVMAAMEQDSVRAAQRQEVGVYLPRLETSLLKPVSSATGAMLGVDAKSAPNLTREQREKLTIEIQPQSLIGPDGQPLASGQIGISTVPPELVRA